LKNLLMSAVSLAAAAVLKEVRNVSRSDARRVDSVWGGASGRSAVG